MITLTDEQARTLHQLLTRLLLNETYRLSDVEDALIWTSPENRQILCPFDSVWSEKFGAGNCARTAKSA
jgi:hypothetical protein